MTRYLAAQYTSNDTPEEITDGLNELAQDGWVMTRALGGDDIYTFIFEMQEPR